MIIGSMNENRAAKEDTNFRNWRREDSSWAILNRMTGGRGRKQFSTQVTEDLRQDGGTAAGGSWWPQSGSEDGLELLRGWPGAMLLGRSNL